MAIGPGDKVSFDFTLTLADGTQVDANGERPLSVVIGQGELLECLERRLIGLDAGARERFEIPSTETLAESGGDTLQTVARSDFPADLALEPGVVIGFELPSGEEVPGTVVEVGDQDVVIDFAHPLAGHDLVFEVHVRSVESRGPTQTGSP